MTLDPSLTTSLLGQGLPLVSTASWGFLHHSTHRLSKYFASLLQNPSHMCYYNFVFKVHLLPEGVRNARPRAVLAMALSPASCLLRPTVGKYSSGGEEIGDVQVAARTWGGCSTSHPLCSAAPAPDGQFPAGAASCSW